MKYLIILGHPSIESLNKVINDEISLLFKSQEKNVVIRNLYEIGFNPVLTKEELLSQYTKRTSEDVLKEQEYVKNADIIIFIYPLWWVGMPAIVKGYIDRVFSYGFAYSIENNFVKKLLTGKTVMIINTHRMSTLDYEKKGVYDSISILTHKNIFEFCGMEVILHYYFESIDQNSDKIALKTKIDALKVAVKNKLLAIPKTKMTSHFFF